ncbi:hypothetical protein, partial [Streptococcus pneumoniae]|uniref:hypothetical protein n=1 Tax=Streptococcus pneumoniae TaxID=1313 RepID=UPI001E571DB9
MTRAQRKALVARLDHLAQRLHPSGPHLTYRFIVVDYDTPDWKRYRNGNCIVCRQYTHLDDEATVCT